MSDALPLPSRPDVEQYKKQAKELLKIAKRDDPGAVHTWAARAVQSVHANEQDVQWVERAIRAHMPKQLSDAQFLLARIHGFLSWPKFVKHIHALQSASSPDANFERAADAIVSGDIETLRSILNDDPEVVRRRSERDHRSTLLHYVSANGIEDFRQKTPRNIIEITTLLLDAGSDVNSESDAYGGRSMPLGLVATSAHPRDAGVQIPLMELLIARGAIIEGRAIRDSLANGCLSAARYYADRGAALTLEGAAGIGRLDEVQRLFSTATEQEKTSAFLYACGYGQIDVVKFLLDQGVRHATALHDAAYYGHLDVVNLLLSHDAPLETRNNYGGTVLGTAVWAAIHDPKPDHLKVIETLVAAGAKVSEDWFTGRGEIDEVLRRGAVEPRSAEVRKAHEIRHVADSHVRDGRIDLALPLYHDALAIYRAHDTPPLELANAIRGLAVVTNDEALWEEAHHLYVTSNVPPGIAETARRLAEIAERRGDAPRAREWLQIADTAMKYR